MQKKRRGARGRAQNLPVFYGVTLLYTLIMSAAYLVALLPLASFFLFPAGSGLRYLALLTPALFILVLLPLRFSFAQALTGRYRRLPFSFEAALSTSLYGEKVAEGALYGLHLIKWAIPLAAAGWVLYYLYNNTEAFTLIKGITDFGSGIAAIGNSIVNFFGSIFGGAQVTAEGGIVEGVFSILGIVGLCVLVLLLGLMRNSAYRYIWAEATQYDKNPRVEARRALRGRRLRQFGVAMINLLLFLPVILAACTLFDFKESAEALANRYAEALIAQETLPTIIIPYGKLAILFFVCYLPLVPIRRMITAHFATARFRSQKAKPEPAKKSGNAMPPLYTDTPSAQDGRPL